MNKFIKIVFVMLAFTFALNAQQIKFKIIETTDSHGAIYPYDFLNDRTANHSLAQITTYLKEQRADSTQEVLLFSGGDILQGTPAVYFYNFETPDSKHLYAEVMNFMKYDVGTVGNHDIEAGHQVYDRFNEQLNFPWLAANAVKTDNGEPYFDPYTILTKQGVKIAVLGLITPAIPHWLPPQLYSGMEFNDMIESAKFWVKKIKEEENPDILIGLFHAGVDYTYGNATEDTYKNENASMLVAEKVPGFDVVFVGHDHHGWNRIIENSAGEEVLLMGGTSSARDFAVADLIVDATTKKIITKKGSLLSSSKFSPDEEFMSLFSDQFEKIKTYVNRPIGKINATITTRDAFFGDSPFMDLINTIQMEISGAQISLSAPLSFNAEIKKGNIYVRDLFKLYRYENMLYTMSFTGAEIDKILEYSYGKWFGQMKNSDDHLLNFVKDGNNNLVYSKRSGAPQLKQRFYNFSAAEGIEYTVDVTKPAGNRVEITRILDGRDFSFDSTYTVAVSSYRGNGGGGHLTYGAGLTEDLLRLRLINSTEKDLRYYIMKWIEEKKDLSPEANNNWKVIPEEWVKKAREKDYELLFGNN